MSHRRFGGAVPLGLFAAFVAGVVVDGWLRTYGPPKPADAASTGAVLAAPPTPVHPRENRDLTPSARPAPPAPPAQPAPSAPLARTGAATLPVATSGDVPAGHLRMPIDGRDIESFKGGFAETRGGIRPHEAVDMLAPRNTPVHAVERGTIAKLFPSTAGGLTIYQFDPSGRLCYYYAHLERYADSVKEGQAVSQGDVIGYVGTSGNAPADTPHLHFAVFELRPGQRWWQGKAIDPYQLFKDRS